MGEVCLIDERLEREDDNLVSIFRRYNLKDYDSIQLAELDFLNFDPAIDPTGLERNSAITIGRYEELGNTRYFHGEATWGVDEQTPSPLPGDEELTGGVALITERRKTPLLARVGSFAASGITPLNEKLIAVIHNAAQVNVDGHDYDIPVISFNIRRRYTKGTATLANLITLADLAGGINNAAWRTFAAGTVRFIGSQIDDTNADWDYIDFTFAAKGNESNVQIPTRLGGGTINIPTVEGWQYVHTSDIQYTTLTDRTVMTPHTAYVEDQDRKINMDSVLPA